MQNSNVVVGKIEGAISQIDTIYDAKGDVTDRLAVNKNLVWHFKDSKWTLKNGKGKKINILTYKPKKGSSRRMGHRQPYTKVEITKIVG